VEEKEKSHLRDEPLCAALQYATFWNLPKQTSRSAPPPPLPLPPSLPGLIPLQIAARFREAPEGFGCSALLVSETTNEQKTKIGKHTHQNAVNYNPELARSFKAARVEHTIPSNKHLLATIK